MPPQRLEVDPRTLYLPPPRASGADPAKLQRQIAAYGASDAGMPPLLVYRDPDARLMIFDGVTRATRLAKLAPGRKVVVEVVGELPRPCASLPTVEQRLP